MKLWSIPAILFVIAACNNNSPGKSTGKENDSTSSKPVTGADVDDHGCKASAGYRWSKLEDKCIRVFEEGIKLDPQEAVADKATAAFIIFSANNNQAEIFIPAESASIILERKDGNVTSWIEGIWVLQPAGTGYELKKNNVVQYAR